MANSTLRIAGFLLLIYSFSFCQAQSQSKTEHVFLITLDGLRWQELYSGADPNLINDPDYVKDTTTLKSLFWADSESERRENLMPFFWQVIAKEGQLYGNRKLGNKVSCTNQQWFSYPGYSEILCGFADDERINSNDKIDNPNTTVLEYINQQAGFQGKVAAFASWDVFPYIINEKRSGIPVNAGFNVAKDPDLTAKQQFLNELQPQIPSPWATVRLDAFTHHYALEHIKKHHPRVVYIAYGETDDFAHEGHYDAYLKSAKQTDAFIKELWDYAQSNDYYKGRTTIIITTDHGRGTVPKDTWKGHGTKIKGADEIWLAVIGPDTQARGEVSVSKQYYQNQVANTVAQILGLNYNQSKAGAAISEAFQK